jgi:hypothetical protein
VRSAKSNVYNHVTVYKWWWATYSNANQSVPRNHHLLNQLVERPASRSKRLLCPQPSEKVVLVVRVAHVGKVALLGCRLCFAAGGRCVWVGGVCVWVGGWSLDECADTVFKRCGGWFAASAQRRVAQLKDNTEDSGKSTALNLGCGLHAPVVSACVDLCAKRVKDRKRQRCHRNTRQMQAHLGAHRKC